MNDEEFDTMVDVLTKSIIALMIVIVLMLCVHFIIGFLTFISMGG